MERGNARSRDFGHGGATITRGRQWATLAATPRLWAVFQQRPCAVCKYGGHTAGRCFLINTLVV